MSCQVRTGYDTIGMVMSGVARLGQIMPGCPV
jgi:hypothetical protein